MVMRLNGNRFVLNTPAADMHKRAEDAGWVQSMPASLRAGHPIYFTDTPYAALPLRLDGECTSDVHERLKPYAVNYRSSFAHEGTPCPSPAGTEFMPFQLGGIDYACKRTNSLIGDEMGVGKTIQAIGVANKLGVEVGLIVCPANVRLQWARELKKWSMLCKNKFKMSPWVINSSATGANPVRQWQIVSYDLLRRPELFAQLISQRFDLIVFDEAHMLKTVTSSRTRQALGCLSDPEHEALISRAARVVCLTGTPLPNRPREAYALMRHLCWDAIDYCSEEAFLNRYNPHAVINQRTFTRTSRLPELRARMRCDFMVRRLKADVLDQLPDKMYELAHVEDNGRIRKAVQAEKMLEIDVGNLDHINQDDWGAIATVRREMGEAMAPRVIEHVKALIDGGLDKVVLFGYHRGVLASYADALSGGLHINGATTPKARQAIVDRFIGDPEFKVLPGHLLSMGIGVDGLQKVCSHCVIAEPSWVPGENEQAISRLDRHGQKQAVMAQFLVAHDSLSEKILSTALDKLQATTETLDGV